MKCSLCGNENAENAKYCTECGNILENEEILENIYLKGQILGIKDKEIQKLEPEII